MPRLPIAVLSAAVLLSACEPIDTSALREIEETAAAARTTADNLNARSDEMQRALEDPVGTLRPPRSAPPSRRPPPPSAMSSS